MSIRTLRAPGTLILLSRQRLTGEERIARPLSEQEAIAIAQDQRVPLEYRVLALHRLMDLAVLKHNEYDALWATIGRTMHNTFATGEIPLLVLRRFKELVPFKTMRSWAHLEIGALLHPSSSSEEDQQAA